MGLIKKTDVHHHFIPESYRNFFGKVLRPNELAQDQEKSSRDLLDAISATSAILSFPLIFLLPYDDQRKAAREANLYAASLRESNPGRFGFFATLPPLLEIECAIEEIRFAYNTLHADGVMLLTSYSGRYLGDPVFKPIWEELSRHNAVVFTHPCPNSNGPAPGHFFPAVLDFPHETTQTALDLIVHDIVREHSNCKIILSHAGGTLPYVIDRAAALVSAFSGRGMTCTKTENEVVEDSKQFYFDLALSSTNYTLDTLLRNFPDDHILFGSDFPYCPNDVIHRLSRALDDYNIERESRARIYYQNASRLFPTLR